MKFLSILFIFLLVFSIAFTSANGAAAASAATIRQKQEQQTLNYQNVNAPFDFAKNNSCVLKYPYYTDKEVGKFLCEASNGIWVLRTDGRGGITESYFNSNKTSTFTALGNLLGCIIILLMIIGAIKLVNRAKRK